MGKNLIACDFDGTVNRIDIGSNIVKSLLPDQWENIEKNFKNGNLTNYYFYCNTLMPLLKKEEQRIKNILPRFLKIQRGFESFYNEILINGDKMIIISDGFDFYIEAFLKKYKMHIDYFANSINNEKHYPHHCSACSRCGTCKSKVLKTYKKSFSKIIYVGDGDSDICPSLQSHILFAKRNLFKRLNQIDTHHETALFYFNDFHKVKNTLNMFGRYKGIFFDLDGTLVDGFDIIYESFNFALKTLGLKTVPPYAIRKVIGPALSEGFRKLVPPHLVENGVKLYREYYKDRYLTRNKLFDGIKELLTMLKDKKTIVGLITNKKGNFAKELLLYLGLEKYFDFIIGAEEGFLPKPESEVIIHLLEKYKLHKDEILYIGDSSIDGNFANKANINFIAVGMGLGKERELYKYKPLSYCFNTKQLTNVLKYLC